MIFRFFFIAFLVCESFATSVRAQPALVPYRQGTFWGYSNLQAQLVVPAQYEYTDFFQEGRALVGKNRRYGYLNDQGQQVIGLQYQSANPFQGGAAVVAKEELYGAIDAQGKTLVPFSYQQIISLSSLLKIKTSAGWGLFSLAKKREVVAPQYDDLGLLANQSSLFWFKEKDKIGLGNWEQNQVLHPANFDELYPFSGDFAVVRQGAFFGVLHRTGQLLLPCEFSHIPSGFAFDQPLQKDGKWLYFTPKGTPLEALYDTAQPFYNGVAAVSRGGRYGFINLQGNQVIPLMYEIVGKAGDGPIAVKKDGKWGFINLKNEVVIPFEYEDFDDAVHTMFFTAEGLCLARKNGKFGFIGPQGKAAVPFTFEAAEPFFDALALVQRNGRYGFVNKAGKEVVALAYSDVHHLGVHQYFDNGLALLSKNGKWGFVNMKGEEITPFIYDAPIVPDGFYEEEEEMSYLFFEGRCRVQANGKIGFIDLRGKEITPLQYEDAKDFAGGLAAVRLVGKWGFINRNGETVTPHRYTAVRIVPTEASDAVFRLVQSQERWGLIGANGSEVAPCRFDTPVDWQYAFKNGLMWVNFEGQEGYVNSLGKAFFE